jgi:hypothetical protein
MSNVVHSLLEWVSGGSALTALIQIIGAVCSVVFIHLHRRCLGILGANRRRPAERQAYDRLRNSLAESNVPARLYAEQLTRFLDRIEHFFGDAGMAERTLFPHAFGLRTPAPLWTAPALDCCLFLALLYPIATISGIWAISGHVGPAETAFRLQANLFAWQRVSVAAAIGLVAYGYWRAATQINIWKSLAWITVSFAGSAILLASGAVILLIRYCSGAMFQLYETNPGCSEGGAWYHCRFHRISAKR